MMDFEEGQKEKFEQKSPLVGGVGRQVFFLRAIKDGDKNIIMHYQRPWEQTKVASDRVSTMGNVELEIQGEIPEILDLSDPSAETPATPQQDPAQQSTPIINSSQANLPNVGAVPSSFDWRTSGKLTSVRDQGTCGSCWAFATVAVLEAAIKIKSGTISDLSEQFLVSCNKNDWNCDGGWWAHDYHQSTLGNLQNRAGAALETDMPYTSSIGTCRAIASHPYAITSWTELDGLPTIAEIKNAIYNFGPVSAAICTGPSFLYYSGGVFASDEAAVCINDGKIVNHAIVLVGWNDADQTWILRNSWGTGWGESGYMRIKWGTSNVGYRASYVNYQSACSYSINPSSANISASGGIGSVTVTTQSGCARNAFSNVSWLTITSGSSGTGSGTVGYSVSANSGSSRTGTLTIAGKSFSVFQQGSSTCTYGISPISDTVSSSGGTKTIAVTTQSGCQWTANSTLGWASIVSGNSGTGNGTVSYSVAENQGVSRSGTMLIAGKNFTINQSAPQGCTYSINSLINNFSSTGGTGSLSVNTEAGCSWTAVSNVSWASIISGGSGVGSDAVSFSVAANNTGSNRTGMITVANHFFTFTQLGQTSSDTQLTNGVAINRTIVTSSRGDTWHFFYFTPPSGATDLSIQLDNMTADVDLYVKHGAKPNSGSYDCNSIHSNTTADSCFFTSPDAGQWWIGVNNWATGTISFRIKASWIVNNNTSLGAALDAPALTWLTAGSTRWIAQTTTTHDGVDATRSGILTNNQSNYMETSTAGPRALSFWWKVSSEAKYDFLRFYVDGIQIYGISGEQPWTMQNYLLPSGIHTLRWSYTKDGSLSTGSDAGWVDQVTIAAAPAGTPSYIIVPSSDIDGSYSVSWGKSNTLGVIYVLEEATNSSFTVGRRSVYTGTATTATITARSHDQTYYYRVKATKTGYSNSAWRIGGNGCYIGILNPALASALETPTLSWVTAGSSPWVAQTTITHDGVDAARSGIIGNSQASSIEARISGPRMLSFWWRVSSELKYDYLRFYVDGIQIYAISGEQAWTMQNYFISSGIHTLKWAYTKDGTLSSGLDTGWVDQVKFTILSPPVGALWLLLSQ